MQTNVTKIYKLSSNENMWGASPRVVEALQSAIGTVNIYPPRTDETLRQALEAHHGIEGLTADHFWTGCGGFEATALLMQSYLSHGDQFIVCPPTFTGAYRRMSKVTDGELVQVPLTADFQLDIPAIVNAITPRTRFVIVCNPNNPTATTMPGSDVLALRDALPDDVLLMADEVYHHFVTDERYPNTIAEVLKGKNIAIIHSFSKGFGLAGLRIGYGIAPLDIVRKITAKRRPFHINALNTAAAIAALEDKAHLENCIHLTIEGREWLSAELDRLGVKHWGSQANFLLMRPSLPAQIVVDGLHKRGVMVREQTEPQISDCVRVSVGTMEANRAFVAALEQILGG